MCVLVQVVQEKSYYIKLLIIRNRLYGIEQYVIDPEREYLNIAKSFKWCCYKNRSFV